MLCFCWRSKISEVNNRCIVSNFFKTVEAYQNLLQKLELDPWLTVFAPCLSELMLIVRSKKPGEKSEMGM